VDITERMFYIKTLRSEDGQQIQALALPNGGFPADGQASCAYFVLSDSLRDQNLVLDKPFVKDNSIAFTSFAGAEIPGGNNIFFDFITLSRR
jgi:hypothetical protein